MLGWGGGGGIFCQIWKWRIWRRTLWKKGKNEKYLYEAEMADKNAQKRGRIKEGRGEAIHMQASPFK